MKKRLISLISLLVCALSACLVFVACGGTPDDGGDAGDGTKYSISKTEVSLEVGEETTLTVTATPAKELNVEWSVSPATVASVDNGKVTALAEGTATVTARVDGKTLTCKVNVTEGSVMYSYTLNETVLSLDRGDEFMLTVDCQPTREVTYVWESSDEAVATVADGKVTAVAAGTATISVKADGEEVASCDVTVIDYVYTVTDALAVDYGATDAKIDVTVTPAKETAYTFTVDADGASVISVDENGNITTLGVGAATVTVKDGEKTVGTCQVTVAPVASVQSALKLHTEASATLNVTILPEGGDRVIAFEVTEGDSIVSVTESGVVTALAVGTATVKATVDGVESFCTVTVADAFVSDCTIAEIEKGAQSDAIDITEGAEYWEQYIAGNEINHKQYVDPEEDIITNTFPLISGKTHYLSDYQAWLSWSGGATSATCSCGKCNKDTQNGGDGGWTDNGTKAYFSHENGTGDNRRDDLLDVVHTFDVKVFPGVSTIKIYTGAFKATVRADVKIGGEVLATQTFGHDASTADILTIDVDVKNTTVVTIEFVITEFPGNGNGFITFAGASVSGPVYRLGKTSTQLLNNAAEAIVVTKNGETVTTGITYASSDESIVTVDENGTLTPVADGNAVVTVTVDGRVRKLSVKVGYGYSLETERVALVPGQTHQINVISYPAGSVATAVFTSEQTGVVTVDDTGLVTAVSGGVGTVTVKIGAYTLEFTVAVSNIEIVSSVVDSKDMFTDFTSPAYIYWEYYLYSEISHPNDIEPDSDGDLIRGNIDGCGGENNWSGTYVYFENGSPKQSSMEKDNDKGVTAFTKYTTGTGFEFSLIIPAGSHEIQVFVGAWQTTAGKVALIANGIELAVQPIDTAKGGVARLATFAVQTDEKTTFTLKISPTAVDEGQTANIRLQAIGIIDSSLKKTASTNVTVSKTELTGPADNSFNMSEVGTLDWKLYNIENAGTIKNVMEKSGADYLGDIMYTNSAARDGNQAWDYKAKFTWNDDDCAVKATDCRDGDTDSHGLGAGYHDNGLADNNMFATKIKVDADVKTITLFVNGWISTYNLVVYDSYGNKLLTEAVVSEVKSGQNQAYAVTLNVTAAQADTLTAMIYRTGGDNIAIAGVAVGGAVQAA